MFDFNDKVVIVTGASSGIGATTAEYFAKSGASLVLCGRNIENLNKVSNKCLSYGKCPVPLIISCDVCDDDTPGKIIEATIKKFGKINVLVNNVGIGTYDTIETIDIDKFDSVMNINLRSIIILTKEAVPHLIKTKGNIVNVSSVYGLRSFSATLSYCISKAALDQFTKCICLELAPKGVRVNSVNPGVIVTQFQRRNGMSEDDYQKYLDARSQTHALGRVGKTKEVASAILYLASEEATFTTGSLLTIDGGKNCMCPR